MYQSQDDQEAEIQHTTPHIRFMQQSDIWFEIAPFYNRPTPCIVNTPKFNLLTPDKEELSTYVYGSHIEKDKFYSPTFMHLILLQKNMHEVVRAEIKRLLNNGINIINDFIKSGCTGLVEMALQMKEVNNAHLERAVFYAAIYLRVDLVKLLLLDGRSDPSIHSDLPLRMVCDIQATQGQESDVIQIVELLLNDNRVDPTSMNNQAFMCILLAPSVNFEVVKLLLKHERVCPALLKTAFKAYERKVPPNSDLIKVVELLLLDPRVDPSFNNNECIRWACAKNQPEIVKMLLQDKRVDPTSGGNSAIGLASEKGHVDVVKLLLDDGRVNPADNNGYAIQRAIDEGHVDIFHLLLQSTSTQRV
ncbi:ankyrin repeat-containing protein [Acrasis kona]|uniref:Ankyrin repeat-containing protein n=1 Tax=Acrasis kona TaxID=1008807 RepID=A0AAW2ZN25_9EUKA